MPLILQNSSIWSNQAWTAAFSDSVILHQLQHALPEESVVNTVHPGAVPDGEVELRLFGILIHVR